MGFKVERLVEELAFRIKRSAKYLDLSRASRSRHQPIREPRKSDGSTESRRLLKGKQAGTREGVMLTILRARSRSDAVDNEGCSGRNKGWFSAQESKTSGLDGLRITGSGGWSKRVWLVVVLASLGGSRINANILTSKRMRRTFLPPACPFILFLPFLLLSPATSFHIYHSTILVAKVNSHTCLLTNRAELIGSCPTHSASLAIYHSLLGRT